MKMILWVEDEISVLKERMVTPIGMDDQDSIKDYFQDTYYISCAYGVDEALSMVKENSYDYVILDVDLPVNAVGNYLKIKNKEVINDFMKEDGWDESSNPVSFYKKNTRPFAGVHLYIYLIHHAGITPEQIRIYSGHLKAIDSFKERIIARTLPAPDDENIFTKKTKDDDDKISVWVRKIIESPERILRHAMMNMCNDMIINNKNMRTIYTRTFEKVEQDKLVKHVNMLKTMVDNGTVLLEDEKTIKIYNQILLLIITSECQEQAAYVSAQDKKAFPQVTITKSFKQLASVLDRVRNMIAHKTKLQDIYTTNFVAFVFLVYVRYMCELGQTTTILEKNILKIFDDDQPYNLSSCYEQLNQAAMNRCEVIGDSWENAYDYAALFKQSFDAFDYEGKECVRMFLFNFISFQRCHYIKNDGTIVNRYGIELRRSDLDYSYIHDHKEETRDFTDSWFDDYFKAFYTVAFPAPNE